MRAEELQPVAVGDALVVNGIFGCVVALNLDSGVALVRLHPAGEERTGGHVVMTVFLAAYLREHLEREVPNLAH